MTANKKSTANKDKIEKVKKDNKQVGEYNLYIKINDVVTEVNTDDIASAILDSKPEFPKTPLTIRVTKGNKTLDRYLQLQQAKRLYWNGVAMQAFIKNLIF